MRNKTIMAFFIGIACFSLTACTNNTESNRYTGTVECKSFYVTSEVAGKIDKVDINEGDRIKENDLAANINADVYTIQKNQAEGGLEAAEAAFDSIPVNTPDNSKKQVEGKLKEAQAAFDLANLNLSRCDVKSQGSGVVSEVLVNKGEIIGQGGNIAKVLDVDNKYIKIYVEESKRDKIKLNDNLKVYYNGKKAGEGEVSYISTESEFTPKNTETKSDKEATVFEVRVKLNKNFNYSPGTLMDVEIK
ncbi:HlyD family secretion protein [Clostridium acetobutylicum]|uniref:Permease, predicted cation efflux pump n=1 Tax=Clostridium acetobutylicum (strain ATCC 824 / DSM 792 / JCM 1419 / IAM 19013 / LMG 5710 / NBRC 13948 / NRRL B-527 / VKM B-1787 / 2291 / W) TaxID=272562 RepID=Q97E46_CLOAB|nr:MULTISPECIES: efflux RND transporter periplasmic adaptor subunit [Clostridium]AAK81204.1 Permease, predicted cation efflux pump [Clostridium acetobutylicum ATCC 824]ADZ22309.1 Permease, predicted cation efflux pump [Clostridium acetobutylicum EA 2018]AEI33605.1 permease, cation efflux pump [Clostridium acetobutylicum DSM 1731]AWV81126.1 efflux RND transporter periplasmic adaptor subunit [Clostridium acetobutylicum]MBC2395671.1 efflux RND transporter periplasmic adaptor subunit [Clostridium 